MNIPCANTDEAYTTLVKRFQLPDVVSSAVLDALAEKSLIIRIWNGSEYRYPRFQFDATDVATRNIIAYVNEILDAHSRPEDALIFWTSPILRMPDTPTPIDLIGTDDDLLIDLAKEGIR